MFELQEIASWINLLRIDSPKVAEWMLLWAVPLWHMSLDLHLGINSGSPPWNVTLGFGSVYHTYIAGFLYKIHWKWWLCSLPSLRKVTCSSHWAILGSMRVAEAPKRERQGLLLLGSGCYLFLIGLELQMDTVSAQEGLCWVSLVLVLSQDDLHPLSQQAHSIFNWIQCKKIFFGY